MKFRPITFITTLLVSSLLLPVSVAAQSADNTESESLVIINGQPITEDLFRAYFAVRHKNQGHNKGITPQEQMAIINELINYTLLAQDAEANKLTDNPAIDAQIKLSRSQLLANAAIQHYFAAHPVQEETLKQRYQERFKNANNSEYKTSHILVESEDEAKNLVTELENGANFGELAKSNSKDTSSEAGGSLDWFSAGQMIPEYEQAVAELKEGGYTHTPVKTDFGWHIILLEKTRSVPQPAFEELRGDLLQEIRQEQMNSRIRELREKGEIKFKTTQADKATTKTD
ncbi:MAG: hypothetical protein C0631_18075 [Sedimenticola sp.]|nr:MAG: hypothetical protein C0631_18075 [Sedimenticola sp.]